MPQKIRCPTAEQLYSARDKIAKDSLRAALAEARELATWAGRRVPNGPAAGALMHGYHVGYDDLDLAIAMIVARVREDTTTKVLLRGSVQHSARFKPGVYAHGTLRKADEYADANWNGVPLKKRKVAHAS